MLLCCSEMLLCYAIVVVWSCAIVVLCYSCVVLQLCYAIVVLCYSCVVLLLCCCVLSCANVSPGPVLLFALLYSASS